MKMTLKITAVTGLAMGLMLLNPVTASASLIYDETILLPAQGFGSAERDLTVQGNGTISGCVGLSANAFAVGTGACMGADAFLDPNGVINAGGDEPNPLTDDNKYGIPLESGLGINSADDIGVLFNATEPGGNSINVTDVTLKFYNEAGDLIGSIDGSFNFTNGTNPGNGVAGFTFVVSPDEQAYVDGLLAQGDIRFALESTLEDAAGGPDTFRVVNINAPVPDGGATLLLLGAALSGLGAVRRFMKS